MWPDASSCKVKIVANMSIRNVNFCSAAKGIMLKDENHKWLSGIREMLISVLWPEASYCKVKKKLADRPTKNVHFDIWPEASCCKVKKE